MPSQDPRQPVNYNVITDRHNNIYIEVTYPGYFKSFNAKPNSKKPHGVEGNFRIDLTFNPHGNKEFAITRHFIPGKHSTPVVDTHRKVGPH